MRELSALAFLILAFKLSSAPSRSVTLSTCHTTSVPPSEYVLDSTELMQMILSGPAPTLQDVVGTWTVDSVFIQYKEATYEGQELYMEMEDMGFPYAFYEDGSLYISSFIPTEGTWILNEQERMLSIRDMKGKIKLDDYLVIRGDVMQLITFMDGDIYISLFHRKLND